MIIIKFPLSLFSTPLCRSGIIEWSTKAVLWGERDALKRQYCRDGCSVHRVDTCINVQILVLPTVTRCWWNMTEYKITDVGVSSEKSRQEGGGQKNNPNKNKTKVKRPIFLPHPQFQMARQVIGSPCWNTLECLLHGGLPASSSSAQWISLKTTSEGFFFFKGPAKPGYEIPNGTFFFSILAASLLSLCLKNMNRKILSLLFLLYNKRDLQYGCPHCNSVATAAASRAGYVGYEKESD